MEVSEIEVGKLYDLTFPRNSPARPEGDQTVRVIVDRMREGHWVSYLGKSGGVELKGSCDPEWFAENAAPVPSTPSK